MCRKYCDQIEKAVSQLPKLERRLIEERYMDNDSEYITDHYVYKDVLQISPTTYTKTRWKAFYKLALMLNIAEKNAN